MIESGLPVAIATDCNPGTSYTESMPFVFGLSVLQMHLSVSEALVASTINAAHAIGMSEYAGASMSARRRTCFFSTETARPSWRIMQAYLRSCRSTNRRNLCMKLKNRPCELTALSRPGSRFCGIRERIGR